MQSAGSYYVPYWQCPITIVALRTFGGAFSDTPGNALTLVIANGANCAIVTSNGAAYTGLNRQTIAMVMTGNCASSTGQGVGGCAIQASQSALNQTTKLRMFS
jgi:hypothetical protein